MTVVAIKNGFCKNQFKSHIFASSLQVTFKVFFEKIKSGDKFEAV